MNKSEFSWKTQNCLDDPKLLNGSVYFLFYFQALGWSVCSNLNPIHSEPRRSISESETLVGFCCCCQQLLAIAQSPPHFQFQSSFILQWPPALLIHMVWVWDHLAAVKNILKTFTLIYTLKYPFEFIVVWKTGAFKQCWWAYKEAYGWDKFLPSTCI